MPVYDYKCPSCGKQEDVMKKIDLSDRKEKCECGEVMEKQLHAPAVFWTIGEGRQSDFSPGKRSTKRRFS